MNNVPLLERMSHELRKRREKTFHREKITREGEIFQMLYKELRESKREMTEKKSSHFFEVVQTFKFTFCGSSQRN